LDTPRSKEVSAAPAPDDRTLGQRALDGQREAWDALIQRHHPRVMVTLLARGVVIERARELAQETWIRLIEQQRLGRLDRLELPGLAVRQAAFLALEDARRRRAPTATLEAAGDPSDPTPDQEERVLTHQQLGRAQAALEACSPSAQRVFRLVYENPDMCHADAARVLGISVQRVRQTLCEVRKRLRAAVEE
jgi:RNA polymerase sigma-70 factor (ECF subfamily)